MFKQIPVTANKIYCEDFLKVAVLNCFTKEAVAGSVRRARFS